MFCKKCNQERVFKRVQDHDNMITCRACGQHVFLDVAPTLDIDIKRGVRLYNPSKLRPLDEQGARIRAAVAANVAAFTRLREQDTSFDNIIILLSLPGTKNTVRKAYEEITGQRAVPVPGANAAFSREIRQCVLDHWDKIMEMKERGISLPQIKKECNIPGTCMTISTHIKKIAEERGIELTGKRRNNILPKNNLKRR